MDEAETKKSQSFFRRVCFPALTSPTILIFHHSAVQYVVSLHKYHEMPLSEAYATGVAQFRSLRAEHHIATQTAVMEAEAYGAKFPPTNIQKNFAKEQKTIDAWTRKSEMDAGAIAARKKWRAIIEKQGRVGSGWTKGQQYVRLWHEGVRPTYAPSLTEPSGSDPSAAEVAQNADFMNLQH